MKCTVAGDDQKRLMLDILKRAYQGSESGASDSDADDGDDGGDEPQDDALQGVLSKETLHKLMLKVESGEEVDLEDLVQEEMEAFLRAVDLGRLNHLVTPWEPWWQLPEVATLQLSASGEAVVVELPGPAAHAPSLGGTAGQAAARIPPPVSGALPPLSSLTRAQPSPTLQYGVLELLFTYTHLMRTFNGDPASDLLHAVSIASHLARSLLPLQPSVATHTPGSVSEALLTTTSSSCSPPLGTAQDRPFAAQLWADVLHMLHSGRPCIVTALADLQRLLEAAHSHLQRLAAPPSRPRGRSMLPPAGAASGEAGARGSSVGTGAELPGAVAQDSRRHRKALKAALLKMRFFLSWANEQPAADTANLASMLAAELDLLQQQLPAPAPAAASSTAGMLAAATARRPRQPLARQQPTLVQEITDYALPEEPDRSSSSGKALDAGNAGAAFLGHVSSASSAVSNLPVDATGNDCEVGAAAVLPEPARREGRDEGVGGGPACTEGCDYGLAVASCDYSGHCGGGGSEVGSGHKPVTHNTEAEASAPFQMSAAVGPTTPGGRCLEGAAWPGDAVQGSGEQLNMLD